MAVGATLKKIRKEKKMTQVQFAEFLGMSRSFIGDIENNRYVPNPNTVEKLANALGISVYYLTTGNPTLKDLTDEELEQQFQESREKFKQKRIDEVKNIETELIQILKLGLGYTEEMFLRESLSFLRDSHVNDLISFTSILSMYNRYEGIYHETNDKEELLKSIEEMQLKIEAIFSTRFGLSEYDDPAKLD